MYKSSERNQWNQGAHRRIGVSRWWGQRMLSAAMVLILGSMLLAFMSPQEWSRLARFVLVLVGLFLGGAILLYGRVMLLRRTLLTTAEMKALLEERERAAPRFFDADK